MLRGSIKLAFSLRSKAEANEEVDKIHADAVYEDQGIDDPVLDLPDLTPMQQHHTPEMTE